MCVILLNKPNNRCNADILRACDQLNNQGIGVAFNAGGKLIVKKDFEGIDEFLSYYNAIPDASHVVTHFRLCSAGDVNIENRHPFVIGKELAFCHNGTLHSFKVKDGIKSDTLNFAEKILIPMWNDCPDFYMSNWATLLILEAVGVGNKLAFLNGEGQYTIINEERGEWDETHTTWFSNILWKNKLPKPEPKVEITNVKANKHHYKVIDKRRFFNRPDKGSPEFLQLQYNVKTKHRFRQILGMDGGKVKYSHVLTVEELTELCAKHNCGVKKLKRRHMIEKFTGTEQEAYDLWMRTRPKEEEEPTITLALPPIPAALESPILV